MNWLEAALYGGIAATIGFGVHRAIHGARSSLTPLGVLFAMWTVVTALYMANPLLLTGLSTEALTAVAAAAVSFTVVYGLTVIVYGRSHGSGLGTSSEEPEREAELDQVGRMRVVWTVGTAIWALLFLLFLTQIRVYTGSGLRNVLLLLRTSLGQSAQPPSGFYYFYFAQAVVPISAVLYSHLKERRLLVVAALAMLSLVLTSGRTNLFIAVISFTFALLLARRRVRARRQLFALGVLSLLLLGVFAVLGNNIGKTYENSNIYATFGDRPPVPAQLVQPLFYVTSPIAYFGVLVDTTPGGQQGGVNVSRPLLQLVSTLDPSVQPPQKIQPFVGVPYPTNLGTYLSPIWRDFGVPGLVVENGVLGLLCALTYARWRASHSPVTTALLAVVLVFCASSIFDASFTELWFALFLAFLAYVAVPVRRRRQTTRRGKDPNLFWLNDTKAAGTSAETF